jgi:NhaP-type Na+/H+ or K+/H+ antiporter
MSTTPPEQPSSRPTMGMPSIPSGARLPIPGNAEFAFFVAIEIFLAILLFDDAWNVSDWAQWSAILGFAYLLSRGIAKASRVLEQ